MAEWRVGQVTLGELIEVRVFWCVSGTAIHSLADYIGLFCHHYPVQDNISTSLMVHFIRNAGITYGDMFIITEF